MNARVREWMRRELWSKRGLWNLCALAAVPLLLLGYLWVGGVLLDRGQEVDDPDIAAYVPARESSPGARALMDMSRLVDQGKYFDGDPTDDLVRDVELLRLYANWIDRDEVDEEDDVLDRFEADESFRRGWVAGLLSSNQFVFAALDRAAADTGFRFADPVGSKYEDGRAWLSPPGCVYAWEGPVFAQIRFDAESGPWSGRTGN